MINGRLATSTKRLGKWTAILLISSCTSLAAADDTGGPIIFVQADRDKQLAQAMALGLEKVKSALPIKLDDFATLVDVKLNGVTMTYVNVIPAQYKIKDFNVIERHVRPKVCAASDMRYAIGLGASYVYQYYSPAPENKLWGQFRVSSCPSDML